MRDFALSKFPGKKDLFRELPVKFVNVAEIILQSNLIVRNNFVSEGALTIHTSLIKGVACLRPLVLQCFTVFFGPHPLNCTFTPLSKGERVVRVISRAELQVTDLR